MDAVPSERDALAWLLSENIELGEEQPKIAAAISEQLAHMELTSHDEYTLRRIRDVVMRHDPKRIIEVGGGIGHLTVLNRAPSDAE